jgi:hypothetical protein
MTTAVAHQAGRVLLLGVTPELAQVGIRTVAVDCSRSSIERIWPGNTAAATAVRADWTALPCPADAFSAAIGDGPFNCLQFPTGYGRLCEELARVVRPGGPLAVRVFVAPDRDDSVPAIVADAFRGTIDGVHSLKWRLAHALCARRRDPNVPVPAIWRAFNEAFPDRATLRARTGWTSADLAQIDAYENVADVLSFPTASQLMDLDWGGLARPVFVPTGGYPLAERCPLLVTTVLS